MLDRNVFIYRNLTKGCWSVRATDGLEKGRVIGHVRTFCVNRPGFKVSEAGRQRVLRERRKNVHAGVTGTLISYRGMNNMNYGVEVPTLGWDRISYSPYLREYFYQFSTERQVISCEMIFGTIRDLYSYHSVFRD